MSQLILPRYIIFQAPYYQFYQQLYLTFQDILDKGITPFLQPGAHIWKQTLSLMPSPYPELADKLYLPSSWDEYDNMTYNFTLEKGSIFAAKFGHYCQ